MNLSGESVREIVKFYNIDINNILVIYDDVDFEVGTFKIRRGGSAGGHNGIRNIIDNLKTENIGRIRIGISKNEIPLMDYVLGKFTPEEDKKIESVLPQVANIINDFSNHNIDELMEKYNRNKMSNNLYKELLILILIPLKRYQLLRMKYITNYCYISF